MRTWPYFMHIFWTSWLFSSAAGRRGSNGSWSGMWSFHKIRENQRAPNPPEFAQPCLRRPNGSHHQRKGTILGVFVPLFGGKKVYTKGVFSSENSSASTGKKRFGVYQKACFQGKRKEITYTPKSLQGVCGGPLRAALVYRFWPPIYCWYYPSVRPPIWVGLVCVSFRPTQTQLCKFGWVWSSPRKVEL